MFILSDQIIILFPADTFSRKQLIFHLHFTSVTSTNFWENDHACQSFAPTMPKVAPDTVNLVLKKKTEKKKRYLILKKNLAELGFLGSISQTRRKCIYEHWTMGAGCGEALRLFYGKHVLAILKTYLTRLELRNYSRMFVNL